MTSDRFIFWFLCALTATAVVMLVAADTWTARILAALGGAMVGLAAAVFAYEIRSDGKVG